LISPSVARAVSFWQEIKPLLPEEPHPTLTELEACDHRPHAKETVAAILERDRSILMERWLARVEEVPELTALPIAGEVRTGYLPEMMKNISSRLRGVRELEAIDIPCPAATAHGQIRFSQGYTAPMIVQESRILQVSIFETIERNLKTVDFNAVLPDIMIIADEVDSQLKQAIAGYLAMQRGELAIASA
jgi:hypothetical protein